MKQFLLITASIIIFYSCKNSGGTEVKKPKSDTTSTLGVFLGYGLKTIEWGPATKLSKDSLMVVYGKDSVPSLKWDKYVMYAAEINIRLDSSLAAALKEPQFDSTGKVRFVKKVLWIDPKYFRDGITDLDSAVKDLKRYLIIDSTNKK